MSSFSQQINTLPHELSYSDIKSDNAYIMASTMQDDSVYNSKSLALSAIQQNTVDIIRNLPEFNPTGTWTFNKGITIPDKTFKNALKNDISATLLPKSYVADEFMKLLRTLSTEIYESPHMPSAVGDVIFTTKLKTEYKVKEKYGQYTSWRQIKGRFLLASTTNASTRGGETSYKLTIDELPTHHHKFSSSDKTTTINVEKTVAVSKSFSNVITNDSGSSCGGGAENRDKYQATESEVNISISYSLTGAPYHLYGEGEGRPTITIKENKQGSMSGNKKTIGNIPPFYSVYIWERIR